MRNRFSAVLPVLLTLFLAACAQPFEARVQSFQALPPAAGQSFAIEPADPKKQGSLEFASYGALVSDELRRAGFVPVAAGAQPDLIVRMDFGAGPGRERLATRPGFSTRAAWGWYGPGWWGRHPAWWGSFYDPFWGPWSQPEVYSFTIYPAFLEVDILRASDKVPLFEGRAETTTRVNDLPATMPKLVTALFTGFPGENARSKVVRVPTGR